MWGHRTAAHHLSLFCRTKDAFLDSSLFQRDNKCVLNCLHACKGTHKASRTKASAAHSHWCKSWWIKASIKHLMFSLHREMTHYQPTSTSLMKRFHSDKSDLEISKYSTCAFLFNSVECGRRRCEIFPHNLILFFLCVLMILNEKNNCSRCIIPPVLLSALQVRMADRKVQEIAQARVFPPEFTLSTNENLIQHARYKSKTTRKVLGGHREFILTHHLLIRHPSGAFLLLFRACNLTNSTIMCSVFEEFI